MEVINVNYKVITVLLAGILGLTGCGVGNSDYEDRNGNPNDNSYAPRGVVNTNTGKKKLDDFGYSRIQEPLTNEQMIQNNSPMIDRRKLADAISKNAVLAPTVEDVATLVTDEEVFIVYSTTSKDRNLIADQVKKSALSVVPRFYHVYVSDDPAMHKQISRYQGLDATTRNVENSINGVIREFKKYPQGKKVSDGENENGEQYGEMDNQLNTK